MQVFLFSMTSQMALTLRNGTNQEGLVHQMALFAFLQAPTGSDQSKSSSARYVWKSERATLQQMEEVLSAWFSTSSLITKEDATQVTILALAGGVYGMDFPLVSPILVNRLDGARIVVMQVPVMTALLHGNGIHMR